MGRGFRRGALGRQGARIRRTSASSAGASFFLRIYCVRAPRRPGPCEWDGRRGPGRRASARPVTETGELRGHPPQLRLQSRKTPISEHQLCSLAVWEREPVVTYVYSTLC
ncbi:hypothetical protein R6Z07F_004815 [Ovis aries]